MSKATVTATASTIINKDPYARVHLAPIMHDGADTGRYLTMMEDEQGTYKPLPGLDTIHSAGYSLVPNSQVHDLVGDILTRSGREFKPMPHAPSVFWNGKHWSEKWYCEDISEEIQATGSTIALGVEAINSYDGAYPVQIRFFAMHLLCSNQFYASNMLGNVVFRHIRKDAGVQLQENVQDALTTLGTEADRFLRLAQYIRKLSRTHVGGLPGFLQLRSVINDGGWRTSLDAAVMDELHGHGITNSLGMQQLGTEPTCYWNILNAYSAVSTHKIGGFNGSRASELATNCIINDSGVLLGTL